MGLAQTGRPIIAIIEETTFAEMWKRTGQGHKRRKSADRKITINPKMSVKFSHGAGRF